MGDQGRSRRTRAEGIDLVQVGDEGAHHGRSHGGSKKRKRWKYILEPTDFIPD